MSGFYTKLLFIWFTSGTFLRQELTAGSTIKTASGYVLLSGAIVFINIRCWSEKIRHLSKRWLPYPWNVEAHNWDHLVHREMMNEPVLPYVLADSIVRNNFYRTTQGNAIPVMVIAKTRLVVRLKIIHFHGADTCRHPDFVKLWHVSWTSAQVADNRRHQWMRWSHFRIGQASGLPFPLVSVHLFFPPFQVGKVLKHLFLCLYGTQLTFGLHSPLV